MSSKSSRPEGFVLYAKTLQSVCLLPEEKAGRVLKAAARLFLNGQEPESLELSEQIVFSLLRDDIDAAMKRHAAVCARNQRIAATRRVPSVTAGDGSLPNAPNMNPNPNPKRNEYEKDKADKPPTRPRFSPPSLEEVTAYCRERRNSVDAQRFIDFYASKGWKIGKNSMQDWKAAVRNWERRDDHAGRSDSGHGADAAQTGSIGGITRL